MSMNAVDTSVSEVVDTGNADLQDTAQGDQTSDVTGNQDQGQRTEKYVPFSSGKEKFKASGKEHEWDWETTRKYAQLGYSGQQALERAATTEKKARENLQRLHDIANTDPDALIEILTGKKRTARATSGDVEQTELDPRDAKIQDLEGKLQGILERDENSQVEAERTAFNKELDDATAKYPILKEYDGIFLDIVKTQYRKALNTALDARQEPPSVEDVAFFVAQRVQDSRQKKTQQKQERTEAAIKKAPATGVPGGSGASTGAMSREEVMRLAGRIG